MCTYKNVYSITLSCSAFYKGKIPNITPRNIPAYNIQQLSLNPRHKDILRTINFHCKELEKQLAWGHPRRTGVGQPSEEKLLRWAHAVAESNAMDEPGEQCELIYLVTYRTFRGVFMNDGEKSITGK